MNRKKLFAIFDDADNSSASFAEQLMALGIASRAEARPFAVEWASKKHKNEPLKKSQRGGMTFKRRGTAAEQAVTRVLDICYPRGTKPVKPKAKKNHKQDAVASLFKKWEALSGAEKRRFARMQIER